MKLPYLPSVLQAKNEANSISMERSLKQIQNLLMNFPASNLADEDKLTASLDDLEAMLKSIKHD